MTRVVNQSDEPFDVYIGRPGPWGNPFRIGVHGSRSEVIAAYRQWILSRPDLVEKAKRELTGKVLGCFCKPAACHGDVLVEICDQ